MGGGRWFFGGGVGGVHGGRGIVDCSNACCDRGRGQCMAVVKKAGGTQIRIPVCVCVGGGGGL